MTWRPTGLDGVFERFVPGEGDTFHVEKTQDVEPILDRNGRLRTMDDGFNESRDGRRIASIPMAVHLQWLAEGFDCTADGSDVELRRRLNSSDWVKLRTSEGAL